MGVPVTAICVHISCNASQKLSSLPEHTLPTLCLAFHCRNGDYESLLIPVPHLCQELPLCKLSQVHLSCCDTYKMASVIKAGLSGLVAFIAALFGVIFLPGMCLPFLFLRPTLYRRLADNMIASWEVFAAVSTFTCQQGLSRYLETGCPNRGFIDFCVSKVWYKKHTTNKIAAIR